MPNRIVATFLAVGVIFGFVILVTQVSAFRLPGNHQGYEPVQPIAFSHRLHAGELKVSCLYCHGAAEREAQAGIPAAELCMNCHKTVTAPLRMVREEENRAKEEGRPVRPVVSPELAKLYDSLGMDATPARVEGKPVQPIAWERIHTLPAFARFDHRSHVRVGVECQTCHGPVESMERVRQDQTLLMGWCVNCHRETGQTGVARRPVDPSLDCAACHN